MSRIQQDNETVLSALSRFLSHSPTAITPDAIHEMTSAGLTEEQGYLHLLASWLELPSALWRQYLPRMLRQLSPLPYQTDPCMQALRSAFGARGHIVLCEDSYAPFELFVANDFETDEDGRVYPQLGWFSQGFSYPALMEQGRIWMTVTPNEINTIRPCAQTVHGKVLAYGLGLGYFAYHALLNPHVDSVTVVECNPDLIRLFSEELLPRFPRADRLRIFQADAFEYAAHTAPLEQFDCVFTDLWHDVGDGLPLYRRMKSLEVPGPEYFYWIEKTIQAYL